VHTDTLTFPRYAYELACIHAHSNPSSAQLAVISIAFVTGFVAVNAYYIMDSIEKTHDIAQILRKVFRMWPAFNLGDGLVALTTSFWERNVLGEQSRPFDWDVAGLPLVLLFCESVAYFSLLLLLEGSCGSIRQAIAGEWEKFVLTWYDVRQTKDGMLVQNDGLDDTSTDDDDIRQEKDFVSKNFLKLKHSSSPIIFLNAWKVYLPPYSGFFGVMFAPIFRSVYSCGRFFCNALFAREVSEDRIEEERRALLPKRAVRGLSFAVRRGEAFVLLGINGSGKSKKH